MRASFFFGLAALFVATSAYADDKSEAARLFEDGRKLIGEGRFSEACPKLAESMRLVPNGGTLLNLAECYEKNGQTASAYLRYREAATRAKAAGQAKAEAVANSHAKSLEATLARLTVRLAPQSAEGTTITIDGEPATIGEATPIDPGGHTVVAQAPARESFSRTVQVPKTTALIEIEMPVLRGGAEPPPTRPPPVVETPKPAPASSGLTTMQWAGIGIAGVGVVSVALGTVFGLGAKSKNDDAAAGCTNNDPNRCTPQSVQLTDDAKSAATLSTVFFIVGGAALAGGAALFFLGGDSPKARTALTLLSGAPVRF